MQTVEAPEIAAGDALTVTIRRAGAPHPVEYEIPAVPTATPVTTPEVLTVATLVLSLLQVPPVVASARVVVNPAQTVAVPVMAAGPPFTVTIFVARQVAVL
jgi:hypothetical protein